MGQKGNNENFKNVLKVYFNKNEALLLPNILCYIRIVLMILFVILYNLPSNYPNKYFFIYIATGIMAVAIYTDFLDGFIARKFNMTSNLGKALDPIIDKLSLLLIGVALVIRFKNFIMIDIALGLFLLKEILLTISVIILARRNKTYGQSKWYGKVSSFLCYIVFGIILLGGPMMIENNYDGQVLGLNVYLFMNILASITIILQLIALIGYLQFFIKLLLNKEIKEIKND